MSMASSSGSVRNMRAKIPTSSPSRESLATASEDWSRSDGKSETIASDDEAEPEMETKELDEDVYGAATYVIIHDGRDVVTCEDHDGQTMRDNVIRFSFTIASLIINYMLQCFILKFTYIYVASPSVHRVQETYQAFHRDCFDSTGVYSADSWDAWPKEHQHQLCKMVFSSHGNMLYALLSLWWMTMLNEVRKNERMLKDFMMMVTTDEDTDHAHIENGTGEDEGKRMVMKVSRKVKCVLYLTIVLPKMIISIILLLIGTVWLTATESFADLILNAVALEFIIGIDDLIFEAMFPKSMKSDVAALVLHTPKEKGSLIKGYMRSVLYYSVIFIGIWAYLTPVGQSIPFLSVIPGYADDAACPTFWSGLQTRPCGVWSVEGSNCFPFGSTTTTAPVTTAMPTSSNFAVMTPPSSGNGLGNSGFVASQQPAQPPF